MRIAMVGHPMHSRTMSSQFFMKILEEADFNIQYFSSETFLDWGPLSRRSLDNFDVLICWQTEDLAEALVSIGKKVILVPMYDAAVQRPVDYWRQFARCKIICFCRTLYEQLVDIDMNAYYFQYYPETPTLSAPHIPVSGLSLFFWQRRPDAAINLEAVGRLVRTWPSSRLHVHLARDEPDNQVQGSKKSFATEIELLRRNGHFVTTSSWFASRGEYIALLRKCNLFLAPRLEEGIGMSFLEPMSMGLCVLANNRATMNEYIYDKVNGVLFDADRPPEEWCPWENLDGRVTEFGLRAAESIAQGRWRWEQDVKRLRAVVSGKGRVSREPLEEFEREVVYLASSAKSSGLRQAGHQRC